MTEKTVYTCDRCLNNIINAFEIVEIRAIATIGINNKLSLDFQDKHFCCSCAEGVSEIIKKAFSDVSEKLKG